MNIITADIYSLNKGELKDPLKDPQRLERTVIPTCKLDLRKPSGREVTFLGALPAMAVAPLSQCFSDSVSPYCDVEDVASHRAGHGHVSHAFTSHNHTGDEVGNGRPRSQDSQAHDLLGDADGFTHLRRENKDPSGRSCC